MNKEEGYIKFNLEWVKNKPLPYSEVKELNECRNRLYQLGLIGVLDNGIGFGNVSIRMPGTNQFIISGTGTGAVPQLDENHYTQVISYNIEKNQVACEGPSEPSSEAMTHAALYEADSNIKAAIHTHHKKLWQALKQKNFPITSKEASYGTPEMAQEMTKLCKGIGLKDKKVLVMGGHEDGVMSFGENIAEAERVLVKLYQENR